MPDNTPQLPVQQVNPNIIPYQPLGDSQSPFKQSSDMLSLYMPKGPELDGSGVTPRTLRPSLDPNLPDALKNALKNALKGNDPYRNAADDNPITTALPLAERYLTEPTRYSIYQDNEDAAAKYHDKNDSFLTKQLNGSYGPLSLGWYGGLAVKAGGKFIDGFGSLYELAKYGGHGLAEMTGIVDDDKINSFGEWMADGGDNFISKIGGGIDKWVDQKQNTFQETEDTKKGLFNRLFTDADLWNTSIKDGAAFMASAFIPAGAITKLGLGAKVAGRLGKIATAIEAEAAATEAIGTYGNIVNNVNKFGSLGKTLGITQQRIASFVDFGANLAYSVPMEASMEGRGVGQTVYQSLDGKINPATGQLYTDDEKSQLGGLAAAQSYRQNLAILAVSNAIELYGMMKIAGLATKAAKAELKGGMSLLEGVEAEAPKFFDFGNRHAGIYTAAKEAAVGVASEGFYEENIQYAIQKTSEQFGATGGDGYGNIAVKNGKTDKEGVEGSASRYWDQVKTLLNPFQPGSNDRELNESVFIGALMGLGGGAFAGVKDSRSENKFNKLAATDINQLHQRWMSSYRSIDNPYITETDPATNQTRLKLDETGNPIIDKDKAAGYEAHLSDMIRLKTITEAAETRGSVTQQQISQDLAFTKMASEYAKYGAAKDLIKKLSDISTLKPEDIKMLFPTLDTTDVNSNGFKTQLASKVMDMQNVVREADASHSFVDKNVLYSAPTKDQVDQYNKETGKKLKAKEVGQILFNAKKQWLIDQSNQNLALKMYDNSIKDDNLKILDQLARVNSAKDLLASNQEDVVAHAATVDALNSTIAQEKAMQNHIVGMEQGIKDKLTTNPADGSVLDDVEDIDKKEAELAKISKQRQDQEAEVKDSKIGTIKDADGFHTSKSNQDLTMEELDLKQKQRINEVKREEIKIAQNKIIDEYKKVIAPKELKNEDKNFGSRNQILSKNQRNQYFEREVAYRNDNFVKPFKLKDKTTKEYKDNETNRLDSERIASKIRNIVSEIAFDKITQVFSNEVKSIEDITSALQQLVDNKFSLTKDEKAKLIDIISNSEPIKSYNDKIDAMRIKSDELLDEAQEEDNPIVAEQKAEESSDLSQQAHNLEQNTPLNSIIETVNSIKERDNSPINENKIRRVIADEYLDESKTITDDFKFEKNEDDKLIATSKKDIEDDLNGILNKIDTLEEEKNELNRLKKIFQDREEKEKLSETEELKSLIPTIDDQLEKINSVLDVLNDLKDSRLREDKNSLTNHVSMVLNEVGTSLDEEFNDPQLWDQVSSKIPSDVKTRFTDLLNDVKTRRQAEEGGLDEKDYWALRASVKAIQEFLKLDNYHDVKDNIFDSIKAKKKSLFDTFREKLKNSVSAVQEGKITDSYQESPTTVFIKYFLNDGSYAGPESHFSKHSDAKSAIFRYKSHLDLVRLYNDLKDENDQTDYTRELRGETFTKQDLQDLLKTHIQYVTLDNLEKSLKTDRNQLQEVEDEIKLLSTKGITIPSNQQLIALRSFIDFFFRGKKTDEVKDFSNWAYLKAPAGTGKSRIIGDWVSKILKLSEDEILATGHTEASSKNINQSIGLNNEIAGVDDIITFMKERDKDGKLANDIIKLVVLDEISGFTENDIKKFNAALKDYVKESGNDVKVLALGDPNQMVILSDKSGKTRLSFVPYIEFSSDTDLVETLPALTIRYRSNNPAINSFSDKFNNNQNDLTNESMKVKFFGDKGVFATNNFEADLIGSLKEVDFSKDKSTRVVITNPDRVALYKKLLADNGLAGKVEVTDFINVQGRTIDNVYIDIDTKDDLFKFNNNTDNQLVNKAYYVSTSRATNFVMIANFNNIENVEDPNITKSISKAEDELEQSKTNFAENRETERSILDNNLQSIKDRIKRNNTEATDKPEEKDEKKDASEKDPITTDLEDADDVEEETSEQPSEKERGEKEQKEQIEEKEKKSTILKGLEKAKKVVLNIIQTTFQALQHFTTGDQHVSTKKQGLTDEEIAIRAAEPGDRVMYVKSRYKGVNAVQILSEAVDGDGKVIPGKFRQIGFIANHKDFDADLQSELQEMSKYPELASKRQSIIDYLQSGGISNKSELTAIHGDSKGKIFQFSARTNQEKFDSDIMFEGKFEYGSPMTYIYNPTSYQDVDKDAIIKAVITNTIPASKLTPTTIGNYLKNSYVKIFTDKSLAEFTKNSNLDNADFIEAGIPYMIIRSINSKEKMQVVRLSRKKIDPKDSTHKAFIKPLFDLMDAIKTLNKSINNTDYVYGTVQVNSKLKDIAATEPGKSIVLNKSATETKKVKVTEQMIGAAQAILNLTDTLSDREAVSPTDKLTSGNSVFLNEKAIQELGTLPKIVRFDNNNPTDRTINQITLKVVNDDESGKVELEYYTYPEDANAPNGYGNTKEFHTITVDKSLIERKGNKKGGKAQTVINAISRSNKSLREYFELPGKAKKADFITGGTSSLVKGNFLSLGNLENTLEILEFVTNFDTNGLDLRVPLPVYSRKSATKDTINLSESGADNIINDPVRMKSYFESNFEGVSPTEMKISMGEETGRTGQSTQITTPVTNEVPPILKEEDLDKTCEGSSFANLGDIGE